MGRTRRRMLVLGALAGAVAAVVVLRRQRLAASRVEFARRYGD